MPKIDAMYAFVVADSGPDDEGVPAFQAIDGTWMPMLGADLARIDSLRPLVQHMADDMGKPIYLRRFVLSGEPDEVIEPKKEA